MFFGNVPNCFACLTASKNPEKSTYGLILSLILFPPRSVVGLVNRGLEESRDFSIKELNFLLINLPTL